MRHGFPVCFFENDRFSLWSQAGQDLGNFGKKKGKPDEKKSKTSQDRITDNENSIPNKLEYMMEYELNFIHEKKLKEQRYSYSLRKSKKRSTWSFFIKKSRFYPAFE
jgi:hypothetical protein